MQGIEQLIRESLKARATDVEPTPELWREVDRRVARRKRFQVTAWSLAGATAALAAVVAAPTVIDLVQPDRTPGIGAVPMTEGPAAGVVPEFYVTDVDGGLQIREVATGEHRPHNDAPSPTDIPVAEIEVRPGSTGNDYAIIGSRYADGEPMNGFSVLDSRFGTVQDEFATDVPLRGASHQAYFENPEFPPSVVWTPDQDAAAITVPAEESDQTNVVMWQSPGADGMETGFDVRELGLVLGEGEVELLDWVGRTTATGDESILYFRDDLGVHAQGLTVAEDGTMTAGPSEVYDGMYDVASSHVRPGYLEAPYYAIMDDAGPVLIWADTDTQRGAEIDLVEVFGHVDPLTLWIDAKQDAAIVGDGTRTFLFAHDGAGDFVAPVELDTAGPAALFDAPRPGTPQPEPTSSDPLTEESATEEPGPTEAEQPASDVGAVLPEPVVTATTTELVLHGPDGEQVLYTLPSEGHSSFLSVAVRPGSTLDDLTIVALHLAEGMQDFRTYRVVDGNTEVVYWDSLQYQPGFEGDLGGPVAAFGPVWHPAGDKLAWIEMGTSGVPNLRIIGWTDDGPGTGNRADDNTAFMLDEFEGMVVEPLEWVDLGGGQTEIRAVSEDAFDSWITIPIEIQADNAAAMSRSAEFASRADGGDGRVGGVAGAGPRWLLQGDAVHLLDDRRVTVTLPPAFYPGEGLPDTWMRELGDGVLVGMSNTGSVYYITGDGDLAQVGDAAWMHGDVVD